MLASAVSLPRLCTRVAPKTQYRCLSENSSWALSKTGHGSPDAIREAWQVGEGGYISFPQVTISFIPLWCLSLPLTGALTKRHTRPYRYTCLYPNTGPYTPLKDFSFEGMPKWTLIYDSKGYIFISFAPRTISKTNYQYIRMKSK